MSGNTDSSASLAAPSGCIDTERCYLTWSEATWDSALFGYAVLQINQLELRGPGHDGDFSAFELARDGLGSRFVSCRLPHDRLRESMFLEDRGFRFIEMLYQPELPGLSSDEHRKGHGLSLARAEEADMPAVVDIAGTAFRNERFHVDFRIPAHLGDIRYQNWVRSALSHSSQRLYVLRDGAALVSFFVTELLEDGTCYWHLNAVAPGAQGKGYGRRAWHAMLEQAVCDGATRVRTSIVARNHRVLNLYAALGFRFPPPYMTYHWIRDQ